MFEGIEMQRCENPDCANTVEQLSAAANHWLVLHAPIVKLWFCQWSCLRDYCDATVTSNIKPTPPTPAVEPPPLVSLQEALARCQPDNSTSSAE